MELLSINSTLGERIRFYRQQAGLTQKELAGLCEVSESAIRNYELGNRVPDFLTLHTIAEKLRVNYAAIAGEKVTDLEGALQALYKLEEIHGLSPHRGRRSYPFCVPGQRGGGQVQARPGYRHGQSGRHCSNTALWDL